MAKVTAYIPEPKPEYDAENLIGKAGKAEKTKFLTGLNEALFSGDIRKPLNKDALDDLIHYFLHYV